MNKTPKKKADKRTADPEIRCKHDELADPTKLKPDPDNPNTHPPEQIEAYGRIVEASGFRRPAVVSRRSGCLTRGHGLVQTAIARGWSRVPVEFQDYPDRAAEVADMIADNQLARMSDLNLQLVAKAIDKMKGDFDMTLTGFDEKTLEALRKLQVMPQTNQPIDEGKLKQTDHECPKCGFKW